MLPNLGTTGSQVEELLVPKGLNQCFPILEPGVPSSRNDRFSNVGTHASQAWARMFTVAGIAGAQRLESILSKLGTVGSQF
jgi:hypothetical protein